MSNMAKKKKKTIGSITNSRNNWGTISPVTKIKEDKKKKNNRKEVKDKLRRGDFNE